ncbi:MAG: AI-2E family transporter, partial [Cyanobacteria bacterium J06641_5]
MCISLAILWQFRQILLLGFMAVVLAVALNKLVGLLVKRFPLKRPQAVALSLLLVLLGGVILAAFV